jgi:hypothetical protein
MEPECSCGSELPDYSSIKTHEQAKKFVEELIEEWPFSNYRDQIYRSDPLRSDYIIVYAGDMSWGDEPQGGGFKGLQRIMRSGLSTQLGIF